MNSICNLKIICTFADVNAKDSLTDPTCGSYFYGFTFGATFCKDMGLPNHRELSPLGYNLSLARRGEVALPISNTYYFHSQMPNTMKRCSQVKHSSLTATSNARNAFLPVQVRKSNSIYRFSKSVNVPKGCIYDDSYFEIDTNTMDAVLSAFIVWSNNGNKDNLFDALNLHKLNVIDKIDNMISV